MNDSAAIEYYSETFTRMSVAYAAAHSEEPAAPGPAYVPMVDDGDAPLPISLTERLALSQEEFEAWVRATVKELIEAEAAEQYVPEETDGLNTYSAVNGDREWNPVGKSRFRIWHAAEDDSVNFYHGGEDLGVPGLAPVFDEDGMLDQARLNESVGGRIAAPPGGYGRVYEKDAELNRIINAYVKAHPEGPKEEHYRELIHGMKMEAAEAVAETVRVKQNADIEERTKLFEANKAVKEAQKKREEDVVELRRLRELQSKASASEGASIEASIDSLLNRLLHKE